MKTTSRPSGVQVGMKKSSFLNSRRSSCRTRAREAPDGWPDTATRALGAFWTARIARQKEIDASIAAKADHEYLYDKPYEDKKRVRVAGPFTVESLSPHRTQAVIHALKQGLISLDEIEL